MFFLIFFAYFFNFKLIFHSVRTCCFYLNYYPFFWKTTYSKMHIQTNKAHKNLKSKHLKSGGNFSKLSVYLLNWSLQNQVIKEVKLCGNILIKFQERGENPVMIKLFLARNTFFIKSWGTSFVCSLTFFSRNSTLQIVEQKQVLFLINFFIPSFPLNNTDKLLKCYYMYWRFRWIIANITTITEYWRSIDKLLCSFKLL